MSANSINNYVQRFTQTIFGNDQSSIEEAQIEPQNKPNAQSSFFSFNPFKAMVKQLVFPSPLVSSLNKSERQVFKETLKTDFGGESLSFRTPEGNSIDGMIFRGQQKKAIVYCVGWKSYFEHPKRFEIIYNITKQVGDIHLMLFNPRGVGESEGTDSSKGAALDLCTAFKYLSEVEQIHPNDIVIYGHSLGACYGALGAKMLQEEYSEAEINLFSERSFANYEDNVRRLVADRLPSYLNPGNFLGNGVAGAINFSDWEGQADEAIFALRGRICIMYSKWDDAVPFSGSCYKKIKERIAAGEYPKQPIRCIKLLEPKAFELQAAGSNEDHASHTRYLSLWERYETVNELKRMLGLESEDPINNRRVKEVAATRPLELQGAHKDFYAALYTVDRLYDYLARAEDSEIVLERVPVIYSSVQTEQVLFTHFCKQEDVLNRIEEDPIFVEAGPQGNKIFYMNVLARTRVVLILEQLEKNFEGNEGMEEFNHQLFQMLEEGMPISFERSAFYNLVNPAQWLYEEMRQFHEESPERDSSLDLKDASLFSSLASIEAVKNLKSVLVQ